MRLWGYFYVKAATRNRYLEKATERWDLVIERRWMFGDDNVINSCYFLLLLVWNSDTILKILHVIVNASALVMIQLLFHDISSCQKIFQSAVSLIIPRRQSRNGDIEMALSIRLSIRSDISKLVCLSWLKLGMHTHIY